jgi:type I restriction enzyme, S subunit
VGKSYLYDPSDGDLVYAGFLINVEPDPRILNARYLAAYAQSQQYWNWVASTSTRSGQPGINSQEYAQLPVPLPDMRVQNAIARTALDVDTQILSLERLIAKKEAIRQGMVQQLLTGETRLPGFGDPWREVVLGKVVSYVKTVALSRARLDMSSQLRYLHYGDIHTSRSVVLDAAHAVIPRAPVSLAKTATHLQVGDLVFVDASEDRIGVGKSVEIFSVPQGGIVAGLHTIAARFDKSVLADGYKAYLQFIPAFRNALLRLAAGTKVLATTRSHISDVVLSLPNTDEQRAIAGTLGDFDIEIEMLRTQLSKTKAIKQGMMQELLTGRTRLPVVEEATT